MRIALYVTVFPALSETFVLTQLEGLLERGHEVDIHALRAGNERLEQPWVRRHRLLERTFYRGRRGSKIGRLFKVMSAAARLLLTRPSAFFRLRAAVAEAPRISFAAALVAAHEILARPAPDLVYAHFGPNGLAVAVLVAAGIVTAPLVTVFHGYDMSLFPRAEGEDCYRILFQEGALMLPVSQEFARRLAAMGCPGEKIRVHHMGVEAEAIGFLERRRAPGETLELLTIARLVEKKGVEYALRALAGLDPEVRLRCRYRIVGDGPLRGELEALVRELDLGARVEFLGWRDHEQIKSLIAGSHALLAPSVTSAEGDEEGIPVVLMEAAAGGLAIVATRHSGIPELVRDHESGLLVDERAVVELSAAINALAADETLALALGRRGREIVAEEFDIAGLNPTLIDILEQQARGKP